MSKRKYRCEPGGVPGCCYSAQQLYIKREGKYEPLDRELVGNGKTIFRRWVWCEEADAMMSMADHAFAPDDCPLGYNRD